MLQLVEKAFNKVPLGAGVSHRHEEACDCFVADHRSCSMLLNGLGSSHRPDGSLILSPQEVAIVI